MDTDIAPSEPVDAAVAAVAFARLLLDRERAGDESDTGLARALEQSCSLIAAGMSRWFGVYGTRALFTRALATAQKQHPSLASVGVSDRDSFEGFSASVEAHGSAAVAAGIVSTIAGIVELLGRMIGEDLAMSLLQQSTMTEIANRAGASLAEGRPSHNDGEAR